MDDGYCSCGNPKRIEYQVDCRKSARCPGWRLHSWSPCPCPAQIREKRTLDEVIKDTEAFIRNGDLPDVGTIPTVKGCIVQNECDVVILLKRRTQAYSIHNNSLLKRIDELEQTIATLRLVKSGFDKSGPSAEDKS